MSLAGQSLLLGDPREGEVVGIIDHRRALIPAAGVGLEVDADAPVGQFPVAVVEELVDRPGVDQAVPLDRVGHFAEVGVQQDTNIRVIDHATAQGGVAVAGIA